MECRSCVTLAVAAAAIATLQPLHATAQSAAQTTGIAELAERTAVQRAYCVSSGDNRARPDRGFHTKTLDSIIFRNAPRERSCRC